MQVLIGGVLPICLVKKEHFLLQYELHDRIMVHLMNFHFVHNYFLELPFCIYLVGSWRIFTS